VNKFYMRL